MTTLKNIFSSESGIARDKDAKVAGQEELSGEVCAAISMALVELDNEVHDIEHTILTISRTHRPYSPWSSKIYGINQAPNFIPNKRR